jgi:hypothetical protein
MSYYLTPKISIIVIVKKRKFTPNKNPYQNKVLLALLKNSPLNTTVCVIKIKLIKAKILIKKAIVVSKLIIINLL